MMKICRIIAFTFLCLWGFGARAAQLNIYLDKSVVSEGETVFLNIEYNGDSKESPDLSGLGNDFQVISNSSSQQFNYINGDFTQIKKWSLGLRPLHQGKITIHPVKLGNLVSNSVQVEVKELTNVAYVPDSDSNTNSPYFQIEQVFEPKNPYIQQQTLLLVNVYDSIGLQEGNISIDEEAKKDWVIFPLLSQPIVKQEVINNKKMNVETYVLALFPQKSGNIDLPQVTFDSYYTKDSEFGFPRFHNDLMVFGVNFHDVFGQKVPVRMKTKKETVNVQAIPSYYSGSSWLPLKNLELSAEWAVSKSFMVGEAVSRTITLKATGMTKSLLPQIKFPDVDGFKQYPEAPVINEEIVQGQLVTTAKINIVYIPMDAGKLSVPEIKLSWFNVDTNKVEEAKIKGETIMVLPNPALNAQTTEQKIEKVAEPEPSEKKKEEFKKDKPHMKQEFIFNQEMLAIAGGVVLFLLIMLFMLRQKFKHKYRNAVIAALKRHDYKSAKDALLIWASAKFYPADVNNFRDISKLAGNEDFSEQLSILNKLLYSRETDYFDISKFIEILKKVDKIQVRQQKISEVLPNLYD